MAENDQIELELESSEETEVSVEPNVDADQFEQAESATQSRRLKTMNVRTAAHAGILKLRM